MSKAECLAGCRVRPETFTRVPSITRYLREPTGRQVNKGIDPTLAFELVASVQSQSNFDEWCVSSVKSRLKRNSSISTCMRALLRVPSMMHRTPSMEMIEDFQNLQVQTDAADDMPSMFLRTPSTVVHEDGQ